MPGRFRELERAAADAVLKGPGQTEPELRRAVAGRRPPADLGAVVEKIHRHAYRVTDEDIASLLARYDADEVFEIVVAASVGAAQERLRAALRALEEA
jgi:hypothetical protein